jgi:hypothetical protein
MGESAKQPEFTYDQEVIDLADREPERRPFEQLPYFILGDTVDLTPLNKRALSKLLFTSADLSCIVHSSTVQLT